MSATPLPRELIEEFRRNGSVRAGVKFRDALCDLAIDALRGMYEKGYAAAKEDATQICADKSLAYHHAGDTPRANAAWECKHAIRALPSAPTSSGSIASGSDNAANTMPEITAKARETVVVPREPTREMLDAMLTVIANGEGIGVAYKSALLHAPKPEEK